MAKKIFVLEDNEDIRDIVGLILEEDYQVTTFEDVKSFKVGIQSHLPDIFLLDVMLPDGNGIEVCKELKLNTRTRNLPVVMMSANFHLTHMAELCQIEDFIVKPFDIDDLKNRIDAQVNLQ